MGAGGPGSTDDKPEPGTAALVQALDIPRLAGWGFGLGLLLTIGTFVFFVVLSGATQSPFLYVGLGFVLALSLGLLLTLVFVAVAAYRLIQSTDLSEPTEPE